ncbi:MAG: hypothetical protein QOH58_2603 [Thermoleophilaceae bacterium]|nr:hypothetical protein [Thermoleophilaceae bacterium]
MEGTPQTHAERHDAEPPSGSPQASPPSPAAAQGASGAGGGLAESRAWLADQHLTRPREGRIIAGVCAGLARRYGAPVFLVRVLMIAFALTGFGLVAYLALWVLMPSDR